jgi:hypothetical protein
VVQVKANHFTFNRPYSFTTTTRPSYSSHVHLSLGHDNVTRLWNTCICLIFKSMTKKKIFIFCKWSFYLSTLAHTIFRMKTIWQFISWKVHNHKSTTRSILLWIPL